MTAAIATVPRRPAPARHRPSYGDVLDLLDEARGDLADADEATAFAVTIVRALVARPPVEASNIEAERRVLGSMVNGRTTLHDVADLAHWDFLGDGHAVLFAALLRQLRQEQAIGVGVRPSARRDPALREREAAKTRRRAVENALVTAGASAAWVALQGLPWPGACPLRDIVRVEELGRWRRGER